MKDFFLEIAADPCSLVAIFYKMLADLFFIAAKVASNSDNVNNIRTIQAFS